MTPRRIIQTAKGVHWVTEQDCTLVVNKSRGETHRLTGLQQMLWDCLILGYGAQKVKTFIVKMGMVSSEAADREMTSVLSEWERRGLVETEEATDG